MTNNPAAYPTLEKIKRLQTMADLGLHYAENEYDRERYEELKTISLELMNELTDQPIQALENFYLPIKDYPTPKVDIRGFVLNPNQEILMVREQADGKWTIPGGWGEIGFSPSEVVIKEVREESGISVNVTRLLAIYDKRCHPHPPEPYYIYKLAFLCTAEHFEYKNGFDIEDVGFFSIDNLPELSEDRILESQLKQLYDMVITHNMSVHFD